MDIPSRPYDTPEFLAWTLAVPCPLRSDHDCHLPSETLRHLWPVRVAGEAIAENRVVDGIALERVAADEVPRMGFRLSDALAACGGEAPAIASCTNCSANVANSRGMGMLAGCFGEVSRTLSTEFDLATLIDEGSSRLGRGELLARHALSTNPIWYGLWAISPLSEPLVRLLSEVCRDIQGRYRSTVPELQFFAAALDTAREHAIPLGIELHPPGWHDGKTDWLIAPHCPRCRAVWRKSDSTCAVCHWTGHHVGMRRRKLRGNRPWRPLDSFLNEEMANKIVVRYLARNSPQPDNPRA